jgi:hypothetical protein
MAFSRELFSPIPFHAAMPVVPNPYPWHNWHNWSKWSFVVARFLVTAAISRTAADGDQDLAPVSHPVWCASLGAVTAATADRTADYGPDLAPVRHSRRHASLRAMSSARQHEHGFRVKDIGAR